MMTDIKEKIAQLAATLQACNAPVLDYLQPGLPPEQIVELLAANNIDPHPALIALYEWRNGVSLHDGIKRTLLDIFPQGVFYSLQDMIKRKKELLEWDYLAYDLGDLNEYWPVFGSYEDDMYLLKNTTGEIYYISPAVQLYGELEYTSIDAMITCANECYVQNIFTIDTGRGLRTDHDQYEVIRLRYL